MKGSAKTTNIWRSYEEGYETTGKQGHGKFTMRCGYQTVMKSSPPEADAFESLFDCLQVEKAGDLNIHSR